MIRTLRESKAKLSELVGIASRGEDVLISVRGKVKARLTSAGPAGAAPVGARWARELQSLHRAQAAGRPKSGVEEVLAEIREDRF